MLVSCGGRRSGCNKPRPSAPAGALEQASLDDPQGRFRLIDMTFARGDAKPAEMEASWRTWLRSFDDHDRRVWRGGWAAKLHSMMQAVARSLDSGNTRAAIEWHGRISRDWCVIPAGHAFGAPVTHSWHRPEAPSAAGASKLAASVLRWPVVASPMIPRASGVIESLVVDGCASASQSTSVAPAQVAAPMGQGGSVGAIYVPDSDEEPKELGFRSGTTGHLGGSSPRCSPRKAGNAWLGTSPVRDSVRVGSASAGDGDTVSRRLQRAPKKRLRPGNHLDDVPHDALRMYWQLRGRG